MVAFLIASIQQRKCANRASREELESSYEYECLLTFRYRIATEAEHCQVVETE